MKKFCIKNVKHYNFSKIKENNASKINEVMDTKEKIELANMILSDEQKIKKVKKEKGIIERTESSLTILTEDNRELLKG